MYIGSHTYIVHSAGGSYAGPLNLENDLVC
jgi:hypothetical protein